MERKGTKIGYIAAVALVVVLMAVAKLTNGSGAFAGTIWSLFPPIAAIILALVTKETYVSLFVGIVAGALFVGNFAPVASLDTMLNNGFLGAIADGKRTV